MLIWMGSQEGDGRPTIGKKSESRGAMGWWLSEAQLAEPWGPWRAPLHLSALALYLPCLTAAHRLLFSPFPAALPHPAPSCP